MALGWTYALLVPLIFVLAAESAKLWNCGNIVENYNCIWYNYNNNCYNYIRCDANSSSTVNWTLVTEAGVTRYLGSCHGDYYCSSPYSSSTLRVNMHSSYSRMRFYNIGVEFSGNLTCQEVTTDGTVDSDTCEINVVRVYISISDAEDGGSGYSYCYTHDATPSTVRWTLVTDSGQTLDLGTCDDVNSCTSPLSPDITLTRPDSYYTYANFRNVHRNLTGQLSCSYTYNGSTQTDTQTLNVYHRASIENCSVDISRHNWSAILSCNITQVFSSAGLYEFEVYQVTTDRSDYMFNGRRSYSNGLTSYVNTSDNQVYYSGSLTYSWRLPDGPVRYTGFGVDVYYGYSVSSYDYSSNIIDATPPDSPSTNCSELNYIPETGVVPCVCTADSLGSPPGRLLWLLGDTVMATGDYNVSQLQFPSGQVSRQHDGMVATCQVDWVQPTSTQFTLHLAYGPDSLSLQVNQSDDVTPNHTIHVISHVTGITPLTSDMVLWGGQCQGQQGFTCTLTPSSAAEALGKTVTCTVTNAANNGHSAEASVIIQEPKQKPDPSQVQTDIDMRLRYVLVTVCSRVTENQVETQVHARVVKENQDWPGLCPDSTCTNAHVTATCDGPLSKSISALVKIERVPATVTSSQTQASRSPRDVLFQAAVEDNAFDLETLNAVLDKTDVLVRTLQTCTPGYTYTGSNCVKDEEPSPDSAGLIGSVIGGVFAFLVVVIFIVLVVVVLRRLRQYGGGGGGGGGGCRRLSRAGKQADDHDYSTLTSDPRHRRAKDTMELCRLEFDFNNPSFDQQSDRPVSDYDFIAGDNPEIADYLAESSRAYEHLDKVSPDKPSDAYYKLRNSEIKSQQASAEVFRGRNGSADVTPSFPSERVNEEDSSDYLSPTEPSERVREVDSSDYLTPLGPYESVKETESWDYLTPIPPSDSVREEESCDYLTPTEPSESVGEGETSDYLIPTGPSERVSDTESSDYLTPTEPSDKGTESSDYLTPSPPSENVREEESSDYLTPTCPSEIVREDESSGYLTPTEPSERIREDESSDYLTPTEPSERIREDESSDYLTPTERSERIREDESSDYLTPTERSERIREDESSDYLTPTEPSENVGKGESSDYLTPIGPSESVREEESWDYLYQTEPSERIREEEGSDYITPTETFEIVTEN